MTKCADCDKGHLMSCGLCPEYNKEFPSGREVTGDPAPIKHKHTGLVCTAYHKQVVAELKAEVERLRERLQFDPSGSDKIDELEQALQFTRHELDVLKAEVDRLKAAEDGWSGIIADLVGRIKSREAHTWEQERESAVSWLTKTAAIYVGVRDVEATHVVSALAKSMAGGLHWITDGGEHLPEGGKE